ncbi:helix-turn-helix transcriptional regulator [Bradyrhizobium sp.]|jgi:transcriptional regulator with XRE-family HTH domain|uniref:helix-turn-helix domain-containing protein n=1 Tax=Bradyrhizobium sp. TaxID=376 RepID=UPI002DFAC69C|nr:helix-turn-helix transcriptional regulator [Bradyrhizobium sp.]
MSPKKNTADVGALVGKRIRSRRIEAGMSQENLAKALGLTLQQVREYEKGTQRISSGLLLKIAELLECNVTHFFEHPNRVQTSASTPFAKFMSTKEGVAIIKAMLKISNRDLRRKVIEIAEKLAET